jgi:hypothetical protein
MAIIQLMQSEFTYNVTTDDGNEYTVMVMEDLYSGHFSIDAFDENSDLVEDERKILEISLLIEEQRD